MRKEIQQFIEENIDLIQRQEWEEVYNKKFPRGFTEILLESGINPLEQGLNYIPDGFSYECENIKKFTIPNNVTNIDYHAFNYCTSLKSIVIPDSVTYIGASAFSHCSSLTSVVIGDNVTSIDDYAFSYCPSLTSITYKGTKKEALTILKIRNKRWREGSPIKKIICTDGVIEL